ncbi:MAG TPA: hypothetical protein VFX70_13045 [Mycobacteriales bacterium]|nr:hypothetical protein [Mycobacteriales bacterium]
MTVLYVLAILAAVAVVVALWRLLGPQRAPGGQRPHRRVLAPDDDPDFLRELDERAQRRDDDESP